MNRFPKKKKCPDFNRCHKNTVYETSKRKFKQLECLAALLQPLFPDNVLHSFDEVCDYCYDSFASSFMVSTEEPVSLSEDSLTPEVLTQSSGELFMNTQEKLPPQLLECNMCEKWIAAFKTSLENCKTTSEKIRLLTAAPIHALSKEDIMSKFPMVTNYMITQARILSLQKGNYAIPDIFSGHPVPETTLNVAMQYYLDDDFNCSRQSPNKKDTRNVIENGVSVKKVKRFMTRTIKETYQLFKENNPDLKLGLTKFYSLKPKWVLPCPSQEVCLCIYCSNFDLLIKAAMNLQTFQENKDDKELRSKLLSAIVCSDNDECIFGECKTCPGASAINLQFFGCTQENDDEITFAFWEKNDLIKKTLNLAQFVNTLAEWTLKMSPHLRSKQIQQEAIRKEKEAAKSLPSWLLIHIDFAENWSVILQDEIQSHHWKNDQVSIFTAVCYFNSMILSYAVVSDDKEHDSAHALLAINLIKEDIEVKHPGAEITCEVIISDGAASHFKNRFQFHEMRNSPHQKKWIFSATGHGKGACDGIGGLVKHIATKHNLSTTLLNSIQSAEKFVNVVQSHTPNVCIKLLDANELKKFRTSKKAQWNNVAAIPGIRSTHVWRSEKSDNETKMYTARTYQHDWKLIK